MMLITTDQPQRQSEAAARSHDATVFVALAGTQRVAVARRGEHPRLGQDLKARGPSVGR
jgi:hypothetical protein